jgi:multiple sugar transport system substrate-binding protein
VSIGTGIRGRTRWTRRLLSFVAVAALATGCGSGAVPATTGPAAASQQASAGLGTPAPSSSAQVACGGAQVTLTEWYHQYGEEGTREAALRYAEDYTKANPNVQVKVEWVPGDYFQKVRAALLTESGPDIFETTLADPALVAAGSMADLSDIFTPDVRAQFDPRSFTAYTIDNKVYGLPFIIDVVGLMYYRKSMLDAAGVSVPKTWEEFAAAAKKLTSGSAKGVFFGNDGGISQAYTLVHAAGGEMVKDDKTVAYNTPEAAAAIATLAAMNQDGSVLLGSPTEWYDPTALINGFAAMQFGGLWMMPAVKKALNDDFVIGPVPASGAGGKGAVALSQWGAAVNGKSKNIACAKEYITWKWLKSDEIQKDFNLSYGFHLPPRIALQKSAEALQSGPPADAVKILADNGFVDSVYFSGAVSTPFQDAVARIVKEGKDAAAELAGAVTVSQKELDTLRGN